MAHSSKIQTAVILAAGLGSRLKHLTKETPKGLIEISGRSLVARSIAALKSAGIRRIIIGTGHLSTVYEDFFKNDPSVEFVRNEKYSDSGSMFTLFKMKSVITEDFLLLESDLLYEPRGLAALMSDSAPDIILASGRTQSGDEVYIESTNDGLLVNMSKNPHKLSRVDAELVGISKVSRQGFDELCGVAEVEFSKNGLHLDYETAFVLASQRRPIKILKIEDLAWCEVDNQEHLDRAIEQILPRIEARA